MNKIKKEKGITLVALIITIVVLLIIAGVAIGTLQESNIIAHAQNAAREYNNKKEEEEGYLAEYEKKINEQLGNVDRIYGTEAFYVMLKSDNKVIIKDIQNGELINASYRTIKTTEYLNSLEGEKKIQMQATAESMKQQYPNMDDEIILVNIGDEEVPGGFFINNKSQVFVAADINQLLDLNNSIVKKKGTYQCYGVEFDSIDIIYVVDIPNQQFAGYAGAGNEGPMIKDAAIDEEDKVEYTSVIEKNNETIEVFINNTENITIGLEATKITLTIKDTNEQVYYYIQDDILYTEEEGGSVKVGCRVNQIPLIENYDITRMGFIVTE